MPEASPLSPPAAAPCDELGRAALSCSTPCKSGARATGSKDTVWDTQPGSSSKKPLRVGELRLWESSVLVSNVQFSVCRDCHSLSSTVYADLCILLNWASAFSFSFSPVFPVMSLPVWRGLQRPGRPVIGGPSIPSHSSCPASEMPSVCSSSRCHPISKLWLLRRCGTHCGRATISWDVVGTPAVGAHTDRPSQGQKPPPRCPHTPAPSTPPLSAVHHLPTSVAFF